MTLVTLADSPNRSYRIQRPEGACAPLIIASPHSGTIYPSDFLRRSRLDLRLLRRSEDAYVDELVGDAPSLGLALICARYARAYVDLNRAPDELDPLMFSEPVPDTARCDSDRVAAGLGVIPRVAGIGLDIYNGKLPLAEAYTRLEAVHKPYHAALRALIDEARSIHGYAVLLDCHSMPSAALPPSSRSGQARPQMILGNRWGESCSPAILSLVQGAIEAAGYRTALNTPYSGGYTTEAYGQPHRNVHVVQIEIDRSLYMSELHLTRQAGLTTLRRHLAQVFSAVQAGLPALNLATALRPAAE